MNQKQIENLAKKNAARAAKISSKREFGKKYDSNLEDDPFEESALKERERQRNFFEEMRKRDF